MRATNAELEELTQSITATEAKLANLTAQNSADRGPDQRRQAQVRGLHQRPVASRPSTPASARFTRTGASSPSPPATTPAWSPTPPSMSSVTARRSPSCWSPPSRAAPPPPASFRIRSAPDVTLMVGDRVVPGPESRHHPARRATDLPEPSKTHSQDTP